MLYKGLKVAASISTSDVPPIRYVRDHHSLAFKPPLLILTFTSAVFSPKLLEIGISLTDTLLSAAEGAEDSVAEFTSLVRARD